MQSTDSLLTSLLEQLGLLVQVCMFTIRNFWIFCHVHKFCNFSCGEPLENQPTRLKRHPPNELKNEMN